MKTGNTQSPSRQPATISGGPGRLSKYIVAGILTALILAVFLAGQLQAPPTAEAQAAVLVSNTGQTSEAFFGELTTSTPSQAQAFTTGANNEGYTLHSIGFQFQSISDTSTAGADLKTTLNENSSGDPGNALCTLSDPASFTASSVNTFDAPTTGTTCPTLTKQTTYFVVVERVSVSGTSTITSAYTTSDLEDTGAAAGWLIANTGTQYDGSRWDDSVETLLGVSYQIQINAEAATIETVVKNTAKTTLATKGRLNTTTSQLAQRFTAEASADGYTLTSISFDLSNIVDTATAGSELTVTLNAESSGLPGTTLCTLSDPSSFSSSGLHTFNAPDSCTAIEAGNTYFTSHRAKHHRYRQH